MTTIRMSAHRMSAQRTRMPRFALSQEGTPSAGTPRLRLTRRGRFVLTSLVATPLVGLALVSALNGGIAAATADFSSNPYDYVTVQAGQSLWVLAETIAPNADPREVISAIVRLNQLENSELLPGDRIAIPAAYSK